MNNNKEHKTTEGLSAVDFDAPHLFATASHFFINHCTKTVIARYASEMLLKSDQVDTSTAIEALDEWLEHEDDVEINTLKHMFITAKKLSEKTEDHFVNAADASEYRLLLFADIEGASLEKYEIGRCECEHNYIRATEEHKNYYTPEKRVSEFRAFKDNITGIMFNERARNLVIILDDEAYMKSQAEGDTLSIDERIEKVIMSLDAELARELQDAFVEKFDAVENILKNTGITISYTSDESDETKSEILDLMLEGYELPEVKEDGTFDFSS